MDKYNKTAAVNYALKYALNPNGNFPFFPLEVSGGDCTNFLSQCLYVGNCPMTHDAPCTWWINSKNNTWSYSWTIAGSLLNCLKSRGNSKSSGFFGIEVENYTSLDLGDTIFYEDSKGKIYHSALVTSFEDVGFTNLPLISQHTINASNIIFIKPKAAKTHFVKIYCR